MGKRKRKNNNGVSFHKDFVQPSRQDRIEALGSFPAGSVAEKGREALPSLDAGPSLAESNVEDALADLDHPWLYQPTPRSVTRFAVPEPRDELDWLAQYPEEGQTFDDYVSFFVTRSGRLKHQRVVDGERIVLLPIVRDSWPGWGPSLDLLSEYTHAFFDRPVSLLPPAKLKIPKPTPPTNLDQPGAFASQNNMLTKFSLSFPGKKRPNPVFGRFDDKTGRAQLLTTSVLHDISSFKESKEEEDEGVFSDCFCVMGITMEDLYDGPTDLFCAGMAFGGSGVALFSFARYHPHLKMHPMLWYHYGYDQAAGSHSYYDDDDQEPTGLFQDPPPLSPAATTEFLRRSTKLLTHELGHLYGIDHCIHNRCLMLGTGHLVEDFAAPSHLCGVCLRKLQWRLGFDVVGRYNLLARAFDHLGMKREARWATQQVKSIHGKRG